MTSAQSTQTARERDDFQHGVFTHYLLEGMKGPADQNEDGFITPGELIDYVAMKMADEVGDLQKPVRDARIAGGSFHIVTNHEQREKLAQALRTQVEEETARKHHARALALLEAEDAHGVSKAERERLRTMVERDIVQVSDEFRARLADAVKAQTLAANVLSEFDELSKADPQFLFVRTEDMPRQREKLLRSALLNRVQIDALADLWPGPGGSWPPRPALRDTEPTVVPGQTDQRRQGARPVIEPPPPPGPPPPPAPPTRWRVLLAAGLAGAAGLALWMWLTPPVGPTLDRRNLQAGLVVRDGWDAAEQAAAEGAYARLIERVNQEIERAWPEEGRIRFNVADIEPYYSNEQVMEALERGAVQLVGELSPYNVYEAARRAQAQPFVQPQWDGRNTYRTVIVGLDPSVISLDQLTRKLVDDRKRVAVSDRASTSGYWYPRAMLVGHETIKESLRPFGDFVEQPSDILKAVCERESNYIAGVVPSYQWDTWAGTPEGRRRRVPESAEISPDFSPCVLTQIQRSPPIPNGAYVISSQLNAILRDRGDRLDNLQDAWTNAVSSFPGTILFPERFENVTFSAYNKDDIFGAKEAGEERVEANMQMTIIIPALVLVGVGLFTVFRRLSRVKATDHPDRVPDRT